MNAIIIITFICWLLYKLGAGAVLVKACKLPGLEEAPPTPPAPPEPPKPPQISERQKLEIQAAVVVRQMGDDPRTVKYMSDDLLMALIRDYIKYN